MGHGSQSLCSDPVNGGRLKYFERFFRFLNRIEEAILCLMLLQMGLSTFLQIVMRYVFHSAITWLDELVHVEVVLLTFFGAALGIKYGSHMCVDVFKTRLKGRWHQVLEAVGHLVIAVYAFLIIYFGAGLIQKMTAHPHFTPTLRIPKHYLYCLVCIALGLIFVRCMLKTFLVIREIFAGKGQEGDS